MERLRQVQRTKDEEETQELLQKRERVQRQREMEDDKRNRQRSAEAAAAATAAVSAASSAGSNSNSKNANNNVEEQKPKAVKNDRSGTKTSLNQSYSRSNSNSKSTTTEPSSRERGMLNPDIASPSSSVSMSQSQSQSQTSISLLSDSRKRMRSRLGSRDSGSDSNSDSVVKEKNLFATKRMAAIPPSPAPKYADTINNSGSGNNRPKPTLTAPKIAYRKRVQAESSSDSDSSSDGNRPLRKPSISSTTKKKNNSNDKKNISKDFNSSSDDSDDNIKRKPSIASMSAAKKKRQKMDDDNDNAPAKVMDLDRVPSPDEKKKEADSDDLMDDTPPKAKTASQVSSPPPPPEETETNSNNNKTSPSKKKLKGPSPLPRNPLVAQQPPLAAQNSVSPNQQQKNYNRKFLEVDDSKLWESDSDEEAVIKVTAKARRATKAKVTAANKGKVATEACSSAKTNSVDSNPSSPTKKSLIDELEDANNEDEERKANRIKQHPHFANPTFGPFDNTPLVLKNLEAAEDENDSGGQHHQVPASLARYLPDFQREGVGFLYNAIINGKGAILGDDMGLGKTVQVISVISAFLGKTGTGHDALILEKRKKKVKEFKKAMQKNEMAAMLGFESFVPKEERKRTFFAELQIPEKMPILLVVPSSVLDNWLYEFVLWGHFSVAMYRDLERESALDEIESGAAEVMVVGHALFGSAKHFEQINAINWKLCVVDEFHVFKSPKGHNSKNLSRLSLKHHCQVVGMTGTPMQNRFEELHNLVDLVDFGRLGPVKAFTKNMAKPIMQSRTNNATKEVLERGEKKRQELNALLRPIYIQRKKTEVLKNMPTKIENVLLCPLSDLQKKVYEHVLNLPDYLLVRGANAPCDCGINKNYFAEYKRLLSSAEKIDYQRKNSYVKRSECCYRTPAPGETNSVLWDYQHDESGPCKKCPTCILLPALNVLYKLSSSVALVQYNTGDKSGDQKAREKQEAFAKIAFPQDVLDKLPARSHERCDAALRNEDHFRLSGKMKMLHELLKKIQANKERVLLFSFSTKTLDIIQSYMESQFHTFLRIDGSTPAKHRQGLVNEFQLSDGIFCFLLSTRAAGVGLNLTAANQVIIFDCEWNPANDEQAQDRSFRIGQKKDVTVHRLIAQGTIDELKYLRQIYKLHLKQETFRSAEGSEAKAPPRVFLGVEKDKTRKGELFGMENLLNFSKDSSFMEKVWKTDKKRRSSDSRGLTGHSSLELAKDWTANGGEGMIENEEQVWLSKVSSTAVGSKEGDQASSTVVDQEEGDQANSTTIQSKDCDKVSSTTAGPKEGAQVSRTTPAGSKEREDSEEREEEEDQEESQEQGGSSAKGNAYDHTAFFQKDRVSTNYLDPDNVMGGQTQTVDDFVTLGKSEDEDDTKVKAEGGDPTAMTPTKSEEDPPSSDDGFADDDNDTTTFVKSSGSPRDALLEKAKRKTSWSRGGSNYSLCGVSAKEIRSAKTMFSMADIFQPKDKDLS